MIAGGIGRRWVLFMQKPRQKPRQKKKKVISPNMHSHLIERSLMADRGSLRIR